jgi:16S rRNA (cytidine1402-2'-O)-methyltransferase
VFSIPGPSAFVAALSISGLPTDRFLFIGFFPQKISARRQLLEQHKFSTHTLIAYESCHRIAKLVEDIISILGEHYYVAIAREITKMHELVHIGTAIDVQKQLRENGYRGEFVILIARQEFHL